MRIHHTAGVSAIFDDDILGGMRLQCGGCGWMFELTGNEAYTEPYICHDCHREICYRPWYSW